MTTQVTAQKDELKVVHFTPKIVLEMKKKGKLWTISVSPAKKEQEHD